MVCNILVPAILLLFVILWIRKQTLVRAWLLAFAGLNRDDEVFPLDPGKGLFGADGMVEFCLFNAFFFVLVCINYVMRNSFPNNKNYRRITAILKWPCLRT